MLTNGWENIVRRCMMPNFHLGHQRPKLLENTDVGYATLPYNGRNHFAKRKHAADPQ
jgi:hypothetical protein